MEVLKASKEDHTALTVLTKLSKNHWDYGAEQIELWAEDLTVSENYIEGNEVFKLCIDDKIIGYYAYCFEAEGEQTIILDNLFINPEYIGKGFGKFLMEDFFKRIDKENWESIVLHSDPNAENFYHKLGFEVIGQKETSILGRYLPKMKLTKKAH